MMNRNFDMTNFEQSLKEHADQLLIVPSRRIWQGIYNNLHPGSKWPSFAMGMLFLFCLIGIGHLNNPEMRRARQISDHQNFVTNKNISHSNVSYAQQNTQLFLPSPFSWNAIGQSFNQKGKNIKKELIPRLDIALNDALEIKSSRELPDIQFTTKSNFGKKLSSNSGSNFSGIKQASYVFNTQKENEKKPTNQEVFSNTTLTAPTQEDSKVEWTYFITPSISSGYFPGISNNQQREMGTDFMKNGHSNVIYKNQIGFETGTQVAFKMDDKWQLITGASLMYSGYQMTTNPVNAEGMIMNLQPGEFQNNSVNNYKLQASIPVGVQYEVYEDKNIQIKISSTIEPSFLISSDVYSLSPDGKSYVSSPDMLRRVNLSGNFGSYISFGTKNMKWQIGPTIRYHILSNFKNNAGTIGNMFDYGLRIGISK